MADVKMPKLSDTMEEGTVLEWKTNSGTEVKKGDVLAEVESDKASFEIEAESEGVLQIVVDQGNPVPVGGLIARIGDGASEPAPTPQAEPAAQDGQQARAQPAGATATAAPAPPPSAPARAPSPPEGVRASPLARRLAREQGIDLTQVRGTGPAGRVVKDDVLAAAGQAPAAASA